MAIAFDAASHGKVSATSLTYSHTCTGSFRILWVGVYINTNTDDVTGVTYNGVAMTRANSLLVAATATSNYLYYLVAPATGANNIVVSCGSSRRIVSTSSSYTGAKQTGQPDAQGTNDSAGFVTSRAVSVTTSADNCWVVMSQSGNSNGNIPAAGSSTTSRVTEVDAGIAGMGFFDGNAPKTPAGSSTLNTTMSSDYVGSNIASFAPDTSAAPTNPSFLLNFV